MKKSFKKVSALLLALGVAASVTASAFAADSSVTYDGNAQDFIFAPGSEHSPTDLFVNFKGVMPGDSLTQKIHIQNDADDSVDVKIYLRSLGAQPSSEEFLSQMNLTVEQDGASTLFEAPADQTAGLTDWVCLGTFKSGASVDLDVTLNVPITMGNDFQQAIGNLDWEFKVEEIPVPTETESDTDAEPDTGTPSTDAPSVPEDNGGAPDTGDSARLGVIGGVALAAGAVVVLTITRRKK